MREVAIGDLCELINGRAFKPSDWGNEGLPIVRIQNLNNEEAPFNRYNGEVRDRFLIDSGALLFSWSGTPGTSFGAFFWHRGPAILNQHIFHVLPKTSIDKNYLRYALNGRIDRIIAQAHGGVGLQHITKDKLEATTIPLPSPDRQRRIADILDKAYAIRRKRREAIALTDELLRSTFLEMFGDPVTNPKRWPVSSLGNLLAFLTSGSRGWAQYYADRGPLFIRIQNVRNDTLDLRDIAFVQPPDSAEARRTAVKPGDVLVSITADLGRTCVVPGDVGSAHISQHLALLRPLGVEPHYLSAFLSSDGGQRQFASMNRHGVKAGLNFDDLRSILVSLPPVSLQRAFAEVQGRVRTMQARQELALQESDALFTTLVNRAFSGQL